jgi:soluble lytic murein transglycosylase-like protein
MLVSLTYRTGRNRDRSGELPRVQTRGQVDHALELLSPERRAFVLAMRGNQDQRLLILRMVTRYLPPAQRASAFEIARAVILEANHHRMDPHFLLAVIAHESQFNIKARGGQGEIGLMQILPRTGQWMAAQAGLKENFNLEHPSINIRLGAMYLALLRRNFRGRKTRYLAAYNMGSANVRRLLASEIEPIVYSDKVMTIYEHFYGIVERANSRLDRKTAAN